MNGRFTARPADGTNVAELEALQPANPFATAGFFVSMRAVGYTATVLGLRDDTGRLTSGCGAFMKVGRLNRMLSIPSLPALAVDSPFWDGLRVFCRSQTVTQLELDTFASQPGVDIPTFGRHCVRRDRCEFVLDLAGGLTVRLSGNHKRNVKKAWKAGLEVRRTRAVEAVRTHHALIRQSLDRRLSRGEDVGFVDPFDSHEAFLRSGVGELFQAMKGPVILSSVLVLRASSGGYYQSAGTSPEGMASGASHFLVHAIANQLRTDGASVLNLGGAEEDSPLARFKEGFGAARIRLSSTSCYIGAAWRRRTGRALKLIQSSRKALLQRLSWRVTRMVVYAADTDTAMAPQQRPAMEFRALTPENLRVLPVSDPAFSARQLERLARFGDSYAYAMMEDSQLAHVSWLLPPAAKVKDVPRVIRGNVGEAEITACETLPAFRGRGIYGLAIRNLLDVARRQGIRRVFMKTLASNTASQSGIEKAGLKRVGSATVILLPVITRPVVWRRFR